MLLRNAARPNLLHTLIQWLTFLDHSSERLNLTLHIIHIPFAPHLYRYLRLVATPHALLYHPTVFHTTDYVQYFTIPSITILSFPYFPLPSFLLFSRARAERESRLKAMQGRAKKGLLSEEEKQILAQEEANKGKGDDCVIA